MSAVRMLLREPSSFADLAVIRLLFEEYRGGLGVDLCFQGFDQELAGLPGKYARPRGRLMMATADGEAAGCVGIRPLAERTCEMKRLYVRPAHRRKGIGKELARAAVACATELGYERMYLDTLASMTEATTLYRALGFREIEPYCFNPEPDVLYFALDLG